MNKINKYKFNDVVKVSEIQKLMLSMAIDDDDRFAARKIFHYSLRDDDKEAQALKCGINVTARDESGLLIGYLRVISDRSYIHYIVDVMVDPKYQGQRVGSGIVKLALDTLKETGFIKILLTAIPGKEGFYKRMGFQETMSPVLALRGEDYPISVK